MNCPQVVHTAGFFNLHVQAQTIRLRHGWSQTVPTDLRPIWSVSAFDSLSGSGHGETMSPNKRSLVAVCLCGTICLGIGVVLWYRYTALDTSHWTTADAINEMVDHPAAAAVVFRRHDDTESKLALAMDIGLLLPQTAASKSEVIALLNDISPPALQGSSAFQAYDGSSLYDGTAASFIPYMTLNSQVTDVFQFPLSCSLILKFPELLDATAPTWGGSGDGGNAVTNCDDPKYQLPASVKAYDSALSALSGFGNMCGTIVVDVGMEHGYDASVAEFAPQILLSSSQIRFNGTPEVAAIGKFAIPATALPLQAWGETDLDSYAKAKALDQDFLRARTDLASYYQASFGLSRAEAAAAAERGIWLIEDGLGWADTGTPDPLAEALLSHASLSVVQTALAKESSAPASMLFVAVNYPEAMKLLLAQQPDRTPTTPIGKTVLMEAAKYNQLESVKLLLAAGADVNAASLSPDDIDNNTPPNPDAPCGDTYMIAHGSRTALMYAAANAGLPVINALLAAGADTGAKDSTGLTALDYLEGRGPVPKNLLLSPVDFKRAVAELSIPNPVHAKPLSAPMSHPTQTESPGNSPPSSSSPNSQVPNSPPPGNEMNI